MPLTNEQLHAINYAHFLADSPTPFHAAQLVAQRLQDVGFARQIETEPWDASPGGHVMVREGAVMAWVVPAQVTARSAFRIVGAHTDSPGLILKPTPQSTTADGWGVLNVETYGGGLWNSWLDRELAIAGRVITTDGREILVRTGAIARLPQLASHLDRSVNTDGLKLDAQRHLHPVWTVGGEPHGVLDRVARDAGLDSVEEILAWDLGMVIAQGPEFFGADAQFIAAGRQDNLVSVHAGLAALEGLVGPSQANPNEGGAGDQLSDDVLVFACFDHEEIGSTSRTGAAGPILGDVLERTARALGRSGDEIAQMMAASTLVSADAGHCVHPNYADRHDPDHHPVLGRGPLLKVNANQRYVTSATGEALWRKACASAGVDSQVFVSNNSVPTGSTIGPISATRLGIETVDVGAPLLSMHSAREMTHVSDVFALCRVLRAYWAGA